MECDTCAYVQTNVFFEPVSQQREQFLLASGLRPLPGGTLRFSLEHVRKLGEDVYPRPASHYHHPPYGGRGALRMHKGHDVRRKRSQADLDGVGISIVEIEVSSN